MTRINVIPPSDLADQHLLAEYRELPRVFALARPVPTPQVYTLGPGHVRFFYTRTGWLSRRQASLVSECQHRGFNVRHINPITPIVGCDGDWTPTAEAVSLNLERLRERLHQRPGWYTFRGARVAPDFYG
mgnify:CR=1 FL=1